MPPTPPPTYFTENHTRCVTREGAGAPREDVPRASPAGTVPIGYQSLSDMIRSVSINSGATICAAKQRLLRLYVLQASILRAHLPALMATLATPNDEVVCLLLWAVIPIIGVSPGTRYPERGCGWSVVTLSTRLLDQDLIGHLAMPPSWEYSFLTCSDFALAYPVPGAQLVLLIEPRAQCCLLSIPVRGARELYRYG